MKSIVLFTLVCLVVIPLAGCMKIERYDPGALVPSRTAASLESRTLSSPAVERILEKGLGHNLHSWPEQSWNLKMLTLAAIYYSPALEQARSQVSAAKAQIVTAGERPNPTFRLRPGIPSPYLYAVDLLFKIRTAGKRKIAVEQARDLTAAARLNLAETAWQVCSNVRAALVNYFVAAREAGLLQAQERLQSHRVALLRQRLAAGEISRPLVSNARLLLLQTHMRVETAEGRIPEARAALAASIGVPVTALRGIHLVWPGFTRPPSAHSISSKQIQRDAVLNRLDVRKALAEYAAAQKALQLQIARQHSNILIGPGYNLNSDYFRLRYAVTLPLFNHNQGPIAQAEAQRKAAAAAFLSTQADAIAESEEALAGYRSAWRNWNASEQALMQLERGVIPKERGRVAAGEAGRLALNAVLMQRPAMAQTWLTALGRTQTALGALEDAVERPLAPDEIMFRTQSSIHAEAASGGGWRDARLKPILPKGQKGAQ